LDMRLITLLGLLYNQSTTVAESAFFSIFISLIISFRIMARVECKMF
jgi:hypothetical protein